MFSSHEIAISAFYKFGEKLNTIPESIFENLILFFIAGMLENN